MDIDQTNCKVKVKQFEREMTKYGGPPYNTENVIKVKNVLPVCEDGYTYTLVGVDFQTDHIEASNRDLIHRRKWGGNINCRHRLPNVVDIRFQITLWYHKVKNDDYVDKDDNDMMMINSVEICSSSDKKETE